MKKVSYEFSAVYMSHRGYSEKFLCVDFRYDAILQDYFTIPSHMTINKI